VRCRAWGRSVGEEGRETARAAAKSYYRVRGVGTVASCPGEMGWCPVFETLKSETRALGGWMYVLIPSRGHAVGPPSPNHHGAMRWPMRFRWMANPQMRGNWRIAWPDGQVCWIALFWTAPGRMGRHRC